MKFYHASQSVEATRAGIVRDIRDVTTYNLLFGADWGDFGGFAPGDEVLVWVPVTGVGRPGAYGVAVVTGPATPLVEREDLLEDGVLYGEYRHGLDGDVVIPIRWIVCRFSDPVPKSEFPPEFTVPRFTSEMSPANEAVVRQMFDLARPQPTT